LVQEGKVRRYGWSTDLPDRAELWAKQGAHFTAVQHDFSVLSDAPEVLGICQSYDLASIARGPLAMGLLTGKYSATSTVDADDVRGTPPAWMRYFSEGGRPNPEFLSTVLALREALTVGGRTLAQGALAYLWARSDRTLPVPGFRTVAQVEENTRALELGALSPGELAEVESLLSGRRGGQVA
jgi:aryl-alcohol dehydrogenase-like predicted oxidoreductase